MIPIAAFVLLAAVDLGAGFGSASAEVILLTDESMEVEVQVEVQSSADAVVVHFALSRRGPGDPPPVSRGDGVFGITTELKPANYEVIFETLGEVSLQSLPVSLTDLGADIGGSSGSATSTTEGLSDVNQGWGWLALAFGAASLAALASSGRSEAGTTTRKRAWNPNQRSRGRARGAGGRRSILCWLSSRPLSTGQGPGLFDPPAVQIGHRIEEEGEMHHGGEDERRP